MNNLSSFIREKDKIIAGLTNKPTKEEYVQTQESEQSSQVQAQITRVIRSPRSSVDLPFLKNKALALELEEGASNEPITHQPSSLTPTGSRMEGPSSLFRALNESSEARNFFNFQVE